MKLDMVPDDVPVAILPTTALYVMILKRGWEIAHAVKVEEGVHVMLWSDTHSYFDTYTNNCTFSAVLRPCK